jgi:hypothetical protein
MGNARVLEASVLDTLVLDEVTCTVPGARRSAAYSAVRSASVTLHDGEFVSVAPLLGSPITLLESSLLEWRGRS